LLTSNAGQRYKETVIRDLSFARALLKRNPQWSEAGSIVFPTLKQIQALILEVRASGEPLTIDIETIGGHPLSAVIRCVGIGYTKRAVVVWFLDEGGVPYWKTPQEERAARALLHAAFADPTLPKLGQNIILFDAPVIENAENNLGPLKGFTDDIMFMHHVTDPELPHGLDYLTSRYTECAYYKSMVADPDAKGNEKWASIKSSILGAYNVKDVLSEARAAVPIRKTLKDWPRAEALYRHELEVAGQLRKMTAAGLRVDRVKQKEINTRLKDTQVKHLKILRRIGKAPDFNPNSVPQLIQMMFGRLQFPILKTRDARTKKGAPSTAKQALFELSLRAEGEHAAFLKSLSAFRKARKLEGTYSPEPGCEKDLPIFPDGKIHPLWRLLTKSGRYAVTPAVNTLPTVIKALYIAGEGNEFAATDLQQAELRVMAKMAGVADLLDGYKRGADVHSQNTAKVFEVRPPPAQFVKEDGKVTWTEKIRLELEKAKKPWHLWPVIEPVKNKMKWNQAVEDLLQERGIDWRLFDVDVNWVKTRDLCKRGVFASNYMATLETVWRSLRAETDAKTGELVFPDLPKHQVEAFMTAWFRAAPEIPKFAEERYREAQDQGFYECPLSGRRRYYKDKLELSDVANGPIQTYVASHMNYALIRITNKLTKYKLKCWPVLQVHDQLVLEGKKGRHLEDGAEIMITELSKPNKLHDEDFFLPPDKVKYGLSLAEV
jgi:DNA polymerase I-like protein with 3'-5' exonuclease and polymerase domains